MTTRETGHGQVGHKFTDIDQVGDALFLYHVCGKCSYGHRNIIDALLALGGCNDYFFEYSGFVGIFVILGNGKA